MSKKNRLSLSLKVASNEKLNDSEYLKKNYFSWRKFRKESNSNYYILPVEIKEYLPLIKSNALNLYLFYCLNANNENGTSWYSTDSLAKELDTTTRSINNWNKDLVQLGLILRVTDKNKSATTFLLPISDYYIKVISEDIGEYIENTNKKIDGELISAAHLFQWRKNSESEAYDQPYNVILLTFEKNIDFNQKSLKKRKYVLIETKEEQLDDFFIDVTAKNFNEDIYQFDSPLKNKFEGTVLFKGVALATKYNLKDNDYKYVLETLETISNILVDITDENVKKIKKGSHDE